MTIVVGMVSQKGGVGKSTLARLLSREYASGGWQVKIADMDVSQGTSVDWKKRREVNEILPEVAVEPFRTVTQALKIKDLYDLLIFDGPPHSMAGTIQISRSSDLTILPTGLSLDDLRPSILLAHELVDGGIDLNKIIFVLCRVGDRENEINEARKYIEQAGYFCSAGSLPEKTGYRRASDDGRALSEVIYPTLKERAEEVAQSLIDRLSKLTSSEN
jgi:chromosome partitioning protein